MISAVIPVFNEIESLPEFIKRLTNSLQKLSKSYEIIFIDDGSNDGSLNFMQNLAKKDKHIRIFSFRKNQGKSEGLTLGFQMAKGDFIVTLDADLQDKPEEIEKLYRKTKDGTELVCGWRKDRRDPLKKIISSKLFNSLAGTFWGLNLHDYNCGLKLYSKEAAKSLRLYGGMHRFIPLLVYGQGFVVDEVPVSHSERIYGKSKYGFSKLWKDLPDIFTMLFLTKYSRRPLHFFGTIGSLLGVIGILVLAYLTILHFAGSRIGNRPLFFFGILSVIAGLQILFTGLLADLILNIWHEPDASEKLHFRLRYDSDTHSREDVEINS